MLTLNRRIVHLGALSTIFMIVFPTFLQEALETRLTLIENTNINSTLTYATNYTPATPNFVFLRQPNDALQGMFRRYHSETFTVSDIHTLHFQVLTSIWPMLSSLPWLRYQKISPSTPLYAPLGSVLSRITRLLHCVIQQKT